MIGGATVGHFSINQFLIAKMPYDAEKDLVTPSLTYELPNVAVVAAQHVPAKALSDFIAWAKCDRMASRSAVQGQALRHISPEFCSRRGPASTPSMCHSVARHKPFRRCWRGM
jgi:hypothetical protein